MHNPCGPSACGSCPLLGMCGDPADLPPEPRGDEPDEVLAAYAERGAEVTTYGPGPLYDTVHVRIPAEDKGAVFRALYSGDDPADDAPRAGRVETAHSRDVDLFRSFWERYGSPTLPSPRPPFAPSVAEALLAAFQARTRPADTVDPDAPDLDPAEPEPEGGGCCGGNCCG